MAVKRHIGKSIGNKSIFFTLSAILIVGLFLLYFSSISHLSGKEKHEVEETKITAVNNFAKNFETAYIPRALYVVTNNALDSITDYLASQSKNGNKMYVNLSIAYPQAILNGTIYNPVSRKNETLSRMEDKTLLYWLNTLTNMSREKMGIYIEYNITKAVITQAGPWKVNATVFIEYNLTSADLMQIIRKDAPVSTEISIEGLYDPLVAVETGGTYFRSIKRSDINIHDVNAPKGKNFVEELLNNETYIYQNLAAPSFLMRFEKNLNASACCGIESLITKEIVDRSPEKGYRSYVDYEYWMDDPNILCRGYKEMPNGEVLLEDNLDLYNVSGITQKDDPLTPENEKFDFKLDYLHAGHVYGIEMGSLSLIKNDKCRTT
ncbi:MAG: hypothetical protein N3D84_02100 [Candidatus Woesearchaeota archaeon]|nr:hypothetical protein [Candidatus Woesearchaeota archaeon]